MSPTEQELSNARNVLQRDYRDDIDSIISDAKFEKEQGNLVDEDDIREHLEQTVDGHQRCIYTHLNFETLLCCSNHDAYTEQMGSDGVVSGDSVNWAALAYMAFLEDVMEEARDAGLFDFPADADDETDADDTCPKCGAAKELDHPYCEACAAEYIDEEGSTDG